MKTKTIELPVIPEWLANKINERPTSIQELLYFYSVSELLLTEYTYVYKHLTDVCIAIKYGYEVEDE